MSATTGLTHGPLAAQDLSKLTGLSVLLPREGHWPYQDRSPVTLSKFKFDLIVLHERPHESFFADRFDYLGEWFDDTRTAILAPEGGWKSNPFGDRRVMVTMRDGFSCEAKTGLRWAHYDKTTAADVMSASLIEDAKPEGEGARGRLLKDLERSGYSRSWSDFSADLREVLSASPPVPAVAGKAYGLVKKIGRMPHEADDDYDYLDDDVAQAKLNGLISDAREIMASTSSRLSSGDVTETMVDAALPWLAQWQTMFDEDRRSAIRHVLRQAVSSRPTPSADQSGVIGALFLFREFVNRGTVKWELGCGHHHPIWQLVAEALGEKNNAAPSEVEYQFALPGNTQSLEALAAHAASIGRKS